MDSNEFQAPSSRLLSPHNITTQSRTPRKIPGCKYDTPGFDSNDHKSSQSTIITADVSCRHNEEVFSHNPVGSDAKNRQSNCVSNTIFDRLYAEWNSKQAQRLSQQYKSKRQKEIAELRECTFSPNATAGSTRLRAALSPVPGSEDEFYLKNMDWVQRKERILRQLQIQQNEEKLKGVTMTPKTNKGKVPVNVLRADPITAKKGVSDFLSRQKKARAQKELINYKLENPLSHIWTQKKKLQLDKAVLGSTEKRITRQW